jgi:hypothetical protein
VPTTTDASGDDEDDEFQNLMPEQRKAFEALSAEVRASFDTSSMRAALSDISAEITRAVGPKQFDLNLDLPPLQLDFSNLFESTIDVGKHLPTIDLSGMAAFRQFQDVQRAHFEKLFAGIRELADRLLPPNWRGLPSPGMKRLEAMVLDEGLALAWVPERKILGQLFNAANSQDRRTILGHNWKRIANSCSDLLEGIDVPRYDSYRAFAIRVTDALLSGHSDAAQALAANLLDTMLRETLDIDDHKTVTGRNARLSIDDLPLRVAIVLGGVWGSYGQYHFSRGDKIPRNFSRHASAHAVSNRQFSRINAVIALMHVTAYLKLLDSGDMDVAS